MFNKVETLKDLCTSLEIISVYDTCVYSTQESLYMFKQKINEIVLAYNHDTNKLLEELKKIFDMVDNLQLSVKKEVSNIMIEFLENGTLAEVINKDIFGYILERLKYLSDLIGGFDERISQLETKYTNLDKKVNDLTDTVENNYKTLDTKINKNNTDINIKVDGIRDNLQHQIDNIGEGGSGENPNIAEALNNINFATGLKGGKHYNEGLECTVWSYTIPKTNGTFKQGFSKYYKTNELNHAPDLTFDKYDICDDISIDYNATVCITGSPNKADGTGFMGVNITDGVIRCQKTDGWFTCGIDSNNSLKFFMPDVSADTIKSQGISNAFDTMQPLVINGGIPSSEIINKYGYDKFYTEKHPRTVFGEDKKGNWVFLVVHGRTKGQKGCTYASLSSELIGTYNLKNATAMDGGGSTELIINHSKVNWNIENYGLDRRKRPHTLCFVLHDSPQNDNQRQANDIAKLVSQLSDRVIRLESKNGVFIEQLVGMGTTTDLNNLNRSGIYWATRETPNAPGGASYGILHFQIEPGAQMQYAFPYADNGFPILMRRINSSTGNWGSWVEPKLP